MAKSNLKEQEVETGVEAEAGVEAVQAIQVAKMVTMTDGRVVEFVGKRRALKNSEITDDGKVQVRIDFANGETRLFTVPDSMLLQFAAHGALQKLGDSYANVQDTDDAVQTLDELIDRLYDGKWAVERQPGEAKAAAGGSSLVKALMEISGKSKEEITTFLSAKTPAEKNAMKLSAKVAPVYQRFEAERLAKSGKVEAGESQLAELGI